MTTATREQLLRVLDELGPDPFLRCGCLECLEVIEASIDTDYDHTEEKAA